MLTLCNAALVSQIVYCLLLADATPRLGEYLIKDKIKVQKFASGKLLAISAAIDGHDVILVIDTGATLSCLDAKFADMLKLRTHSQTAVKVAGSQLVPTRIVQLPKLQIASLPTMSPYVGVVDLSWMKTLTAETPNAREFAGVLGSDILGRCGAVVNYTDSTLELKEPSTWDLFRVQGEWRAVAAASDGTRPIVSVLRVRGQSVSLETGQASGLKRLTGELFFYPDADPRTYYLHMIEHIDPPLKAWRGEVFGIAIARHVKKLMPLLGRYDIENDKLTMSFPAGLQGRRDARIPKTLRNTGDGEHEVVVFERVRHHPAFAQLAANLREFFNWALTGTWPKFAIGSWRVEMSRYWLMFASNSERKVSVKIGWNGEANVKLMK